MPSLASYCTLIFSSMNFSSDAGFSTAFVCWKRYVLFALPPPFAMNCGQGGGKKVRRRHCVSASERVLSAPASHQQKDRAAPRAQICAAIERITPGSELAINLVWFTWKWYSFPFSAYSSICAGRFVPGEDSSEQSTEQQTKFAVSAPSRQQRTLFQRIQQATHGCFMSALAHRCWPL
jgi:hypothetical protein